MTWKISHRFVKNHFIVIVIGMSCKNRLWHFPSVSFTLRRWFGIKWHRQKQAASKIWFKVHHRKEIIHAVRLVFHGNSQHKNINITRVRAHSAWCRFSLRSRIDSHSSEQSQNTSFLKKEIYTHNALTNAKSICKFNWSVIHRLNFQSIWANVCIHMYCLRIHPSTNIHTVR